MFVGNGNGVGDRVSSGSLPQGVGEEVTTTSSIGYTSQFNTVVTLEYFQSIVLTTLFLYFIFSGLLGKGWKK